MKTVTETNTTARSTPDGPPGLEGGVTLTHPNANTGGGGNYDTLKAEAIVLQVLYPIRDVECTKYVSRGAKYTKLSGK